MTNRQEILAFIGAHKAELMARFNLVKIGLFGSYAREEQNEESDIDLIVEFKPNTPDLANKKEALKEIFRREFEHEVDICREKYLKPYFKKRILRDTIYV